MYFINSTFIRQNLGILSNWADSTTVPEAIDSVTYDLYESSNPFRKKFTQDEIHNKSARIAANAGTAVGAEVFSVFTNPFYITHKIGQIPAFCNQVVSAYKHNSRKDN